MSTAPKPIRAQGRWLDDLTEGMTFTSDTYEVTVVELTQFASRYDPQPFHLDDAAARGTFFDGLAASGWHTAAITMRLLDGALELATGIIGSEITLKWPTATRPGDVLHVDVSVESIAMSTSRPDRGIVTFAYATVNQHGEVRQQTTGRVVMWRRPEQL
jgi:acyl dehydratase